MFIHDDVDFYTNINTTVNITCVNLNAGNVYTKAEVGLLICECGGGWGWVETDLTDFYNVEYYDPYAHKVQRFAGSDNFTQHQHMNWFDTKWWFDFPRTNVKFY